MLKVTTLFLLTILNTSLPMCAPGCVYGTGGRWGGSWGCVWSDIPLCVVDCIPKAWCVHNGESQLHALLFYVYCVLSDLHSLHDPLWRRGKLRQGKDLPHQDKLPTPTSSAAQTASSIHTAPLPTPRLQGPVLWEPARSAFPNTGNAGGCWLWPQPLAALCSFLGFLESFGGQRLTQRAGFWSLPCLGTQVFRELAGGLPG